MIAKSLLNSSSSSSEKEEEKQETQKEKRKIKKHDIKEEQLLFKKRNISCVNKVEGNKRGKNVFSRINNCDKIHVEKENSARNGFHKKKENHHKKLATSRRRTIQSRIESELSNQASSNESSEHEENIFKEKIGQGRYDQKKETSSINEKEKNEEKRKESRMNNDKILEELWYTKEDEGFVDSFYNLDKEVQEKEQKMLTKFQTRNNNSGKRIHQKNIDNNLWELNKLNQGGVRSAQYNSELREINEMNNTNEVKKIVLTRNLNPPFISNVGGRISNASEENRETYMHTNNDLLENPFFNVCEDLLTHKNNSSTFCNVVKDETCDFAKNAKKGSEFLKYFKTENEKSKGRDRYWEIENSKLGKLLKLYKHQDEIEEEEEHSENHIVEDTFDYKKDKKFASSFNFGVGEMGTKNSQEDSAVNGVLLKQSIKEKEKLVTSRQALPIYRSKDKLLQMIYNNNIVVVVGETGSGKTTQLVQYLYEEGYHTNGIICCTQPRRVAAVSVAYRVAYEMNVEIGTLVGYTIRFEDNTSKETKIRYVTDGILLRETLIDTDLDKYSVIIMDEAHERSINTDVLFGILKNISLRRNDLKLIVTSATLDSLKFSDFFGKAPIFNIEGRTHPVHIEYLRTPCHDYIECAVQKAIEIHVSDNEYNNNFGDILIFMTGQDDINATCYLLSERFYQIFESYKESKTNKQETIDRIKEIMQQGEQDTKENQQEIKNKKNIKPISNTNEKNTNHKFDIAPFYVFPIYAQLSSEQQSKIFKKYKLRKIIVSTNIAETSLTLDGIKYVIDTGYCKLKVYNQKIGMDVLQVTPISQANANQRSGRAGRTGPGVCFRLYTENTFLSDLYENNIPEIQRSNLSNVVLLLKSLNVKNIFDFDFMDPPSKETIINSLYELWILGAINNESNLTELGKKMIQFPLDPPLSKIVIYSEQFKCCEEILIIVSMLSSSSIFLESRENSEAIESKKEKFTVPESDHLTLLNIYLQWKMHNYSYSWCNKHFIQYKSMNKAKEVYSQLSDIFKSLRIENVSCKNKWNAVRKTICSGYFHNAAKLKSFGEYINLRTNVACHVHPNSSLYNIGYTPDYVIYQEIVFTTKEFMRNVTTVEAEWLCELGPMFFYMKSM